MSSPNALLLDSSSQQRATSSIKSRQDRQDSNQEKSQSVAGDDSAFKQQMNQIEKKRASDQLQNNKSTHDRNNKEKVAVKEATAKSNTVTNQSYDANTIANSADVNSSNHDPSSILTTTEYMNNTHNLVASSAEVGLDASNGHEFTDLFANVDVESSIDDALFMIEMPELQLEEAVLDSSDNSLLEASALLNNNGFLNGASLNPLAAQGGLNPLAVPVTAVNTLSSAMIAELSTVTDPLSNLSRIMDKKWDKMPPSDALLASTQSEAAAETLLEEGNDIALTAALPANRAFTATTANIPQLTMDASFNQAKWGDAVTEKVMWMSSKGVKEASIQLDPPELGHLTIKVSLTQQEQAQVSFTAQNNNVREALEHHSQRLKDMFAEEGMDLTDVDVHDQSSNGEQGNGDSSEQDPRSMAYRNRTIDDSQNTQIIGETPLYTQGSNYSLIDSYV